MCELQRERIESDFLSHLESAGFEITPELSLVTDDNSLLFTNSTIVAWKSALVAEALPKNGFAMKQRCLRFHGLGDDISRMMLEERKFSRFIGNFNMVGAIVPSSSGKYLAETVLSLFSDIYGISPAMFAVHTDGQMPWATPLTENFLHFQNALSPNAYHWEYGLRNIKGHGATLSVLQPDDSYQEIGQMIALIDEGRVIGYEVGFGVEVFQARVRGDTDYSSFTISQAAAEPLQFKGFLDLAGGLTFAMSVPDSELTSKHKREIRRVARRVVFMESLLGLNTDLVNQALHAHGNLEFSSSDPGARAVDVIDDMRLRVQSTEYHAQDMVRSLSVRGYGGKQLRDAAMKRNTQVYRLPPEKINMIIDQLGLKESA